MPEEHERLGRNQQQAPVILLGHRQAVSHYSLKVACGGSNPPAPTKSY